jgi:hypothetical protein
VVAWLPSARQSATPPGRNANPPSDGPVIFPQVASFNLTATRKFPEGTSVGAYPASQWRDQEATPSGAPPGAATASATVTNGVAAFTGLTTGVRYWAGASVSGTWQYAEFIAGADQTIAQQQASDSQAGTLAARPSATTDNNGMLYFATDDNGGTLYRSNGAAWVRVAPRGSELGYAENVSAGYTTAAGLVQGTFEDVTSLSITFTGLDRPIMVTTGGGFSWSGVNANGRPAIAITDAAGVIKSFNRMAGSNGAGQTLQVPTVSYRFNPVSGTSYTFKTRLGNAAGGGTSPCQVSWSMDPTAPAFITAEER